MDAVGLWLVDYGTVTGATELIIDGCYTSAFENYVISARIQTSNNDSFYQNRAGGSNATSNYNRQLVEAQSSSISTNRATAQSSFVFTSNSNGNFWQSAEVNIYGPAVADATGIQVNHCRSDGNYTVPSAFLIYGNHSTATAYDGFRIFVPTGTINAKVWVYGRRDQ